MAEEQHKAEEEAKQAAEEARRRREEERRALRRLQRSFAVRMEGQASVDRPPKVAVQLYLTICCCVGMDCGQASG